MTDAPTAPTAPTLNPAWLRGELEARNLSQLAFARLIGCDARTVRRWCDARRTSPLRPAPLALIRGALSQYDALNAATIGPAAPSGPAASSGPASPSLPDHLENP